MRNYPPSIVINGQDYAYEKILKEDFFSVNVLYGHAGDRYVLKLSDFRFIFGILLRPLAMLMSAHEFAIYSRIADIEGIPELGPRLGRRGYLHHFIPGRTLNELAELPRAQRQEVLPRDFFERLGKTLTAVHARRIFYADLDKRGNVILGDDGRPWLIDFQICIYFSPGSGPWGRFKDRLLARLCGEDVYHLYKQKRRYQPQLLSPQEATLATRTGFSRQFNRWFGTPYRRLKRLLYPQGSNDLIWYKWKRRSRDRQAPTK